MILHGIEVNKFKWNDAEVTEEEYLRLDEEWSLAAKKSQEDQDPPEKNPRNKRSGK